MEERKIKGRIIRGIAGFYYVAESTGIWECKAKGGFRKQRQKPLVGDYVEIVPIDEENRTANITDILPRKNALIRPAVANVDQAMVLFALRSPNPDASLLDRFLISMQYYGIPVFLCLNKQDLASEAEVQRWEKIYTSCGYKVILCSARQGIGMGEVRARLSGKTTVEAGPSGVGKSTMTNLLQDMVVMQTGEISRKLKRGKHTTRHAELIPLCLENGEESFLCDTPGFTSLDLPVIRPEELADYFPEFTPYEAECRFSGCAHIHEPVCGVKEAVKAGKISSERYENYCRFYEELKERERHRY